MLAMETGWRQPDLLVLGRLRGGFFLGLWGWRIWASWAFPWLLLRGGNLPGSLPSGIGRSSACAPTNSQLARVVSKCVLLGTMSPFLHMTLKRMRSAARP